VNKLAVDIGTSFNSPFGQEKGIGDLVSAIISNALVIAGVILVFFFVIGGISMMAGAGQDNPEKAAKGKQAATSALLGFIIIFAAYWIIRIIESITGLAILNPGL
jgi:hypothetical protein